MKFKILDNLNHSAYFKETNYKSELDAYDDQKYMFNNTTKKSFLSEIKKHSEIKKQAGYSNLRDCEYISLVLVFKTEVEGTLRYSISSTCLIDNKGIIQDSNNNTDYFDNSGEDSFMHQSIITIYHILPDEKIAEYFIKDSYEKEIKEIYQEVKMIRLHYDLCSELPNLKTQSKLKI